LTDHIEPRTRELIMNGNGRRKIWRGLCILGAVIASPSQATAAPVLVLEYRFNETGTTATSSGADATPLALKSATGAATDLHSADQLGVSGLAGDRSLDNTAALGMGAGVASGGRGEQPDIASIDHFRSFTITGWFKTQAVAIRNAAHIIDNDETALAPPQSYGYRLEAGGTAGTLHLVVDTVGIGPTGMTNSPAVYTEIDQWVFFAVSYDGTRAADNVGFFKGSPTGAAARAGTGSADAGEVSDGITGMTVGNNGDFTRPVDGYLDDIRIFGNNVDASGVLSASDLELIRQADLLNQPIPEPASLATITPVVLLTRRMCRRRAPHPPR
jgi:fibronectin-binding autotransporter adhesin